MGKVVLKEEAEQDLARHLALFSATIVDLEKRTETDALCDYLFELAQIFNRFYRLPRAQGGTMKSERRARLVCRGGGCFCPVGARGRWRALARGPAVRSLSWCAAAPPEHRGRARAMREPREQRLEERVAQFPRDAVARAAHDERGTFRRRHIRQLLDEDLVEGPRPRRATGCGMGRAALVAGPEDADEDPERNTALRRRRGGRWCRHFPFDGRRGAGAGRPRRRGGQHGAREAETVVAAVDGRFRRRRLRWWWSRGGLGVGEGPERAAGGHRSVVGLRSGFGRFLRVGAVRRTTV